MITATYDGIVLAGGNARRLGGVTKPSLEIGGQRLIDIAISAMAGADLTVAVGAALPTAAPVTWTREEPVGGGPVAAIAAGMARVTAPVVVVLAADLPFVTAQAVSALIETIGDGVAAVAVDADGRDQPLLACYRAEALRAALPSRPASASMRALLSRLGTAGSLSRIELGGSPPVTWDCDTAADFDRAREMA